MRGRSSALALGLGFVAAQAHVSTHHRDNTLQRPKRPDQAGEEDIDEDDLIDVAEQIFVRIAEKIVQQER